MKIDPSDFYRSLPSLPKGGVKTIAQGLAEENYADRFYSQLRSWITRFNKQLDAEHEVGIRLVSFGQSIEFHLTELGYQNPSLIIFYGLTNDGNPVELIQHVTQISILLLKVPRIDPTKPKFGFGQGASA